MTLVFNRPLVIGGTGAWTSTLVFSPFIIIGRSQGSGFPILIWVDTDEQGISGPFPMEIMNVHIEDLLNSTYYTYNELD